MPVAAARIAAARGVDTLRPGPGDVPRRPGAVAALAPRAGPGYVAPVTSLRISRDDAGQRVDRFLRKALPGSTLGNLFKMLRKGVVRVDGRRVEGDHRLVEGEVVEIRVAAPAVAGFGGAVRDGGAAAVPNARPGAAGPAAGAAEFADPAAVRGAARLKILHRDDHVLAVDKPPHVLVQPGEDGDGPTLQAMVLALVGPGDSHTFEPSLAHRLDRGTSGIVLFGLSAVGLRGLTEAFRTRKVEKRYLALVAGDPAEDRFTVDLPLARDPSDDRRGAKVKVSRGPGAQSALTTFRVLARHGGTGVALVEALPQTGRTHQIRAHLRAAKLPIVGDPTYGDPRRREAWAALTGLRRQFLHAWRVRLPHPAHAEQTLSVESPLPPDLARALAKAFGGRAPDVATASAAAEGRAP